MRNIVLSDHYLHDGYIGRTISGPNLKYCNQCETAVKQFLHKPFEVDIPIGGFNDAIRRRIEKYRAG